MRHVAAVCTELLIDGCHVSGQGRRVREAQGTQKHTGLVRVAACSLEMPLEAMCFGGVTQDIAMDVGRERLSDFGHEGEMLCALVHTLLKCAHDGQGGARTDGRG